MLYRFFVSKKGFTMMEILVVVLVLGILVAIAVPIFTDGLKKQRQNDCRNQRLVIQTTIQQAMYGMIDNGRRQEKIYFTDLQSDHYCQYPGDGVSGNADDAFVGQNCFVIWYNKIDATNQVVFTLGDLRGGYRDLNRYEEYKDGCNYHEIQNPTGPRNYLKKERLKDIPIYEYFDNMEIPVCPFADEKYNKTAGPEFLYYVLEDGTVLCSCPECNEID